MHPQLKTNLIATFHQWAEDNGYIVYIQTVIDDGVIVPDEFVVDNRITLNISSMATNNLSINNNSVSFNARFSGQVRNIFIPANRINAIFIKDTNIGLGFPISDTEFDQTRPQLSIVKKPPEAKKVADKTVKVLRKRKAADKNIGDATIVKSAIRKSTKDLGNTTKLINAKGEKTKIAKAKITKTSADKTQNLSNTSKLKKPKMVKV